MPMIAMLSGDDDFAVHPGLVLHQVREPNIVVTLEMLSVLACEQTVGETNLLKGPPKAVPFAGLGGLPTAGFLAWSHSADHERQVPLVRIPQHGHPPSR